MKTYRQIVHDLCLVYSESEARALARWLCEERFDLSQADILLDKDNQLSADDIEVLREITSRLIKHEPIQYILGETDFCGHRFSVAPGALIPRPETAELVGHILQSLDSDASVSILDIGTGTGCIGLSLALGLPQARVTAWDISPEALTIARRNAERYPEADFCLEQADILNPPVDDNRRWDLIVSNPPYVRQSEAEQMAPNVLRYEPHLALFVPDDNPLQFYRSILWYAMSHLAPKGVIWFEINQALGEEMRHLIEYFGFSRVEILKDGFGNDRFARCERPEWGVKVFIK